MYLKELEEAEKYEERYMRSKSNVNSILSRLNATSKEVEEMKNYRRKLPYIELKKFSGEVK